MNELTICLSQANIDAIGGRIHAIAPHARFITPEQLSESPQLWAEVNISYGVASRAAWSLAANLRWVQLTGAGVDGLLTPEVLAHPARITNARIHGHYIAEHLFGMLLMLTRRLHIAYQQQLAHEWRGLQQLQTLQGKTLGLLGLGAIGSRCVDIARAFGMRVIALRRTEKAFPGVEHIYQPNELAEMLPQCDIIMITLPLTNATRHLIGTAELSLMKPSSMIFNIGRGKIIDSEALVAALRSGTIAGAGLDVTDPEPLPAEHPLWDMPQVLITPHYSGAFPDYAEHAAAIFLENLQHFLKGEALRDEVDKELGY